MITVKLKLNTIIKMALSKSVEESLREAESSLRNALAYAARQENPYVAREISDLIFRIDALIKTDQFLEKMQSFMDKKEDSDNTGGFFK